jgi:hypothetical protein
MSPLLAQSRHPDHAGECPLSGVKRLLNLGLPRKGRWERFAAAPTLGNHGIAGPRPSPLAAAVRRDAVRLVLQLERVPCLPL